MRRIFDEDGHDVTAAKRNIFRDGRANTVIIQDDEDRFNITVDDLVENSFYLTSTSITGDKIQIGNCIADECGFIVRNSYGTPTTTVTASTGLTVVCDAEAFANRVGYRTGKYEFTYLGGSWVTGVAVISLADYGITLTGTPTALASIVVDLATPYKYDTSMFKGASLSIWICAFDEGERYRVPLQKFVVDTVDESGINISVKALDMFTVLNMNATPEQIKEELDFGTATVYDGLLMFAYAMGLSGVTYNYIEDAEIADFIPNGNVLLVDFTDKCTNLRQILTYLLEICGSCARIRNGNLDICWYSGNILYSDWDITSENRISGTVQPNYLEFTGLNVKQGESTVYSRGENIYTYTIVDNPVVAFDSSVFDEIYYSRIKDDFDPGDYLLYFYPFTATTLRNATIEPFDLLNFYTNNDTERHQIVVTDYSFRLNSSTAIAGRGENAGEASSETGSSFTREQQAVIDVVGTNINHLTKEASKVLANETYTVCADVELQAGFWLLLGVGVFREKSGATTEGLRHCGVFPLNDDGTLPDGLNMAARGTSVMVSAVPDNFTSVEVVRAVNAKEGQKFGVVLYHDNGGSLTVYGGINAIRLK